MRKASWLALTAGLVLAYATAYAAGCGADRNDCSLNLTCSTHGPSGHGGQGGDTSSHGGNSTGGMDQGDGDAGQGGNTGQGGTDVGPDCTHPPMDLDGGVSSTCGIFAAPASSPGGDGSQQAPFTSLQAAINHANATGKPVLACGKTFTENLQVPSGVVLYGGLDCDHGWVWNASLPTQVVAPPSAPQGGSEIALRLLAGTGTTVLQDVQVTSPSGQQAGVSSIAALLEDTAADLARCTLTASDGTPGAAGTHLDDDPGLDGVNGANGYPLCGASSMNPGPKGPVKTCGAQTSTGGDGGDGGPIAGTNLNGGAGNDGTPAYPSTPDAGRGGSGQATLACTHGGEGAPGDAGTSGTGAAGKGTLAPSGYTGAHGADGTEGTTGQGGGGGGGSKGKTAAACPGLATIDRAGASGGSGASGGCGGKGGGGGQAGGSSLALVSLTTHLVTLTKVTLNVSGGGKGGDGGNGQAGGFGGGGAPGGASGVPPAKIGCNGGDGGTGGAGGPGGGGQGGHAIGIAFQGKAPVGTPQVHHAGGTPLPGSGGAAGANSTATKGSGDDGLAGDQIDFSGP